jgi:putative molybdopterin biosynthesis protein
MTVDSNTIQKLIGPDELAEALSISKAGVYRLVERGIIPHYKVGRCLRFDVADIKNYLEKNRVGSIN